MALIRTGGGAAASVFELITEANMSATAYTFSKNVKKALLVCCANTDGGRMPDFTITTDIAKTQVGTTMSSTGQYFRHKYEAYELDNVASGDTITVSTPNNMEGVFAIYEVG